MDPFRRCMRFESIYSMTMPASAQPNVSYVESATKVGHSDKANVQATTDTGMTILNIGYFFR